MVVRATVPIKQAFHGPHKDDSSVFITALVQLRLLCKTDTGNQKIIWQNPRPSSTRYCRPLKFSFLKESTQTSLEQKNRVEEEIRNLNPTELTINHITLLLSHNLHFTMVDGKVCNALTEITSTQTCYISNALSKDFNSIDRMIEHETKQKIYNSESQSYMDGYDFLSAFCTCPINFRFKSGKRGVTIKPQYRITKNAYKVYLEKKLDLLQMFPSPVLETPTMGIRLGDFFLIQSYLQK